MAQTNIVGALFALALPSIFSTSISVNEAFTHPLSYQFFIYHMMLITLGIYILFDQKDIFRPRHYFSTMTILLILCFSSIYINSVFASFTYVNGELQSVEYITNFFFIPRTAWVKTN